MSSLSMIHSHNFFLKVFFLGVLFLFLFLVTTGQSNTLQDWEKKDIAYEFIRQQKTKAFDTLKKHEQKKALDLLYLGQPQPAIDFFIRQGQKTADSLTAAEFYRMAGVLSYFRYPPLSTKALQNAIVKNPTDILTRFLLVKNLLHRKKADEALTVLEEITKEELPGKNNLTKGLHLLLRGEGWQQKNALTRAQYYYSSSFSVYKALGNKPGMAAAHTKQGELLILQKNFSYAYKRMTAALALYKESNNKQGSAELSYRLSGIFILQKKFIQAQKYIIEALSYYEEIDHSYGMTLSYNRLGHIYELRKMPDEAARVYGKSADLQKRTQNKHALAKAYASQGRALRLARSFDRARFFTVRALDLYLNSGEQKKVATQYIELGLIHKTQANAEAAKDYFTRALATSREIHDTHGEAVANMHLGFLEYQTGERAMGCKFLQKSLRLYKQAQDKKQAEKMSLFIAGSRCK